MKIEKAATNPLAFRRPLVYTPNCRSAIELFLRTVGAVDGAPVLIPAYIGWSPREGSGIHDPILAASARLEFYRVGRLRGKEVRNLFPLPPSPPREQERGQRITISPALRSGGWRMRTRSCSS